MAEASSDSGEIKNYSRISDIVDEPHCWLLPIEGYEMMPLVSLEKATEPLTHIVPDIKRKVYIAKQICTSPADNLSSDESASIMLYTMEWNPKERCPYFSLNTCLRSKNRENLKPWYLYLKLLLTALDKLQTVSCTVYRGVKKDISNKYEKDSSIIWWGFSSCTKNIEALQSENFVGKIGDRTLFAIQCHSGKDIRQHSYFTDENEILLPPARQFKVVGSLDQGHGLYMIQLEETDPEFDLIEPVSGTKKRSRPDTRSRSRSSTVALRQKSNFESQIQNYRLSARINLTFQNLTDRDMQAIVDMALVDKLCTELDLSDNNITSEGISILARALVSNTTLRELCLSSNGLSDDAVFHLTEVLKTNNSALKVLGLGANTITDEGVKYLAQMIKINKSLIGLALHNNKIGSDGVNLLMNALKNENRTLETLNLSFNKSVNDSCVDSIIGMLTENQTLKELHILKCSISSTHVRQIQQVAKSKSDFQLNA